MQKIYVTFKKVKNKSIVKFLEECYGKIGNDLNNFRATYSDLECTKLQCKSGNRSFEDIYCVVKTYYKYCSIKHFAKQFLKFLKLNKRLVLIYCKDISKWVFMNIIYNNVTNNTGYLFFYRYQVSMPLLNSKGKGKYNYYDIMKLMGYTKEQCIIT